jgi:hypothetical protein
MRMARLHLAVWVTHPVWRRWRPALLLTLLIGVILLVLTGTAHLVTTTHGWVVALLGLAWATIPPPRRTHQ